MRRNVLITGASSGLGAEMARQLAARGHDLALCARRTERLEELRAEIVRAHPERRVEVRPLDVDDHAAVFDVFRAFRDDLGTLDRVVVNAGIGRGGRIGTGRFENNRATAVTNFVSGLAQLEAAMEVFRAQSYGHLVVVSSVSAMRGMPKGMATYAASKAGVAHLAEGLRAELLGSDIKVTVLYPGYIASEMNAGATHTPYLVQTDKGVAAMVEVIEAERASARVPAWPWRPLGLVLRFAPLPVARRFM